MKRLFDIVIAAAGLAVSSPLLLVVAVLIWLQDFHSPFYRGERVGRDGRPFRMLKFRSMVARADRTGVRSTAGDDRRITRVGHVVRRLKLDELTQLWNVLKGEMSMVGPRPNVPTEVALYSQAERGLLAVRPGITDFASIVFSDEGEILRGSKDPDRDYNLLIRPWKSRLGLHYIAVRSMVLDVRLILLTAVAAISRPRALRILQLALEGTGAPRELVRVAGRSERLLPTLPPGVTEADWEKHLTYA
jgi:lipopolysaccharide/colanic/teichoic acid biosynthesis glycosyltransferase